MSTNSTVTTRRSFMTWVWGGAFTFLGEQVLADTQPTITVWKDPNCGCCDGWVDHLRRNGIKAAVIPAADMSSIKAGRRVPADLASCHTAEIEGYTIEGHVPAHAILRLISERPSGLGLAVPGMPVGSPGMEGGPPEAYDVLLFGNGTASRFARFIGERLIP